MAGSSSGFARQVSCFFQQIECPYRSSGFHANLYIMYGSSVPGYSSNLNFLSIPGALHPPHPTVPLPFRWWSHVVWTIQHAPKIHSL